MRIGRSSVRVEFRPREVWVGARTTRYGFMVDLWVSVIPMLPVHVVFLRKWKGDPAAQVVGGRVYRP